MAMAHLEERALEHRRLSWFFGHLIGCAGHFKSRPNIEKLIKGLNAPVESKQSKTFKISTKQDLLDYEKNFGIQVTPDAE